MRGISSLVDTDMEDSTHFVDENMILSSDRETEFPKTVAPTKSTNKQVARTSKAPRKTTAAKQSGVRRPVGKAAPAKRKATVEQVDDEILVTKKGFKASGALSGDELEDVGDAEHQNKEAKAEVKAKPKRKAKAKKETVEKKDDADHNVAAAPGLHSENGTEKQTGSHAVPTVIPQPAAPGLDSGTEAKVSGSPERPTKGLVRAASHNRSENLFRRRAGSASDTDKIVGDPNLRRKLGDVTRKFENIDLKYRNLKDVGIAEANTNMEKLRKQCEATTTASSELIASLKQELAMHWPVAREARQLEVGLQHSKDENTQIRSHMTELEASLAAAQNEIKALQAKLAAARSSATAVESANSKTPGSAIKNSGHGRTIMVGSAEAAQAAQTAQLKEDLYSDLTGLIIRSVKRTEEGELYDCIQTGRNGTLHFKLVVEAEAEGRTTSFEETEFLYTPLLDPNRDRAMIEVLPYYLKEDITFSRHHATKFYSRLVDALTKQPIEE